MRYKKILAVLCILSAMIFTQACSGNTGKENENAQTDTEKEGVSIMGTSVTQNGAKADGMTDDSAAFAITNTDGTGIVVPAGKYKIAQSVTVTLPITFAPGAVLDIDHGATVTFNGYVDAGLYCIFENGNVIMKKNSTVYPEWFGAVNDGTVDSTSAIQRAVNCFPCGYGKVEFCAGKYIISDTIEIQSAQCP